MPKEYVDISSLDELRPGDIIKCKSGDKHPFVVQDSHVGYVNALRHVCIFEVHGWQKQLDVPDEAPEIPPLPDALKDSNTLVYSLNDNTEFRRFFEHISIWHKGNLINRVQGAQQAWEYWHTHKDKLLK